MCLVCMNTMWIYYVREYVLADTHKHSHVRAYLQFFEPADLAKLDASYVRSSNPEINPSCASLTSQMNF
jgi:hypothetical protein